MVEQCLWGRFAVVTVGFIVEGDSEKLLVESPMFTAWLEQHQLQLGPVINANGINNILTPQHLQTRIQLCQRGTPTPTVIVLLLDLEQEPCYTSVKQRIHTDSDTLICIARKAVEAWFLADSEALSKWLGQDYTYLNPEATQEMPWETLKILAAQFQSRGTGTSKVMFAKQYLKHKDFCLERAAQHPHCPSAAYFLDKLRSLTVAEHPNA